MKYRHHILGSLLPALFLAASFVRADDEAPTSAKALEQLKEGNARFAMDKLGAKNLGEERRQELAKGQKPFAIILTCADSRVAPEIVFDQGLGDLFVLRVAGHVADPVVLGTIEYAVEHLHCTLIVVMGHESCGAVKAAIDGGNLVEGNVGAVLKLIDVGKDLPKDPKEAEAAGVKNNVLRQTASLSHKSAMLKELASSKRLEILPAVYSLESGKVEWLDPKDVAAIKEDPKVALKEDPKPAVKEDPKVAVKEDPKPAVKEDPKPTVKEDPKPTVKEDPKPAVKEDPKPAVKEDPKPAVKEDPKPAVKEDPKPAVEDAPKPAVKEDPKPAVKEAPKIPTGEKKVAKIEVRLPTADAKVWINGAETKSVGLTRVYHAPALPTDGEDKYQFKFVWFDQGKEVSSEKTVTVQGGKTTVVEVGK